MDGILSILKPPGLTSQNVVNDVKHLCGVKKAGHLGTLDPGAAGVLPVAIGRATQLFDLLVEKEKEYIAEIAFGFETDTQDIYGTVISRSDAVVTEEMLCAVLPQFTGEISQVAPAYSALKVDGKKMYELARSGQKVPDKVRSIRISSLEYLGMGVTPNRFMLRIRCSRGTYIRTICADIGRALGVPACMSFLLRSATGPFTLERSCSVEELKQAVLEERLEEHLISCEEALSGFQQLRIPAHRTGPAKNGLTTTVTVADGLYRLYAGNEFLGIGVARAGEVKLFVHLYQER